jgi:N-methylhydantoinase B
VAPVVFYRREFRESSGGAGKRRGGLGQVIEIGGAGANPVALLCNFERVKNPARGRDGGQSGAAGTVTLRSGRPIRPKGRQTVPPRDAIRLELPGGGGFGDPRGRDPERVRDDVLDGLITTDEARRDYGVVIDARGEIDRGETARIRNP